MRHLPIGRLAFAFLFSASLHAQSFTTTPCNGAEETSHSGGFFGSQERACEIRHTALPLVNGQVAVSGTNGSIEVTGEDRHDIALDARVTAQGSSHDDAVALLHRVEIDTHGTIHATGPTFSGWFNHGSWSVSYTLRVPRNLGARLQTVNGGIDLTDLNGNIDAGTTNGPLTLRNLSGDVHAETTNGGLTIALAGNQWHGAGLSARSTNGGVSVKAADHYSAHLVADTVNGGIDVRLPMTAEGPIKHHVDTNLGSGGATLHFETVNGGIEVARD